MNADLAAEMKDYAAALEVVLDRLLSASMEPNELTRPARLLEAMRYGSLDVANGSALFFSMRPHSYLARLRLQSCVLALHLSASIAIR